MKLPTVDKFFFCLSLEVGSIVLAGFSINISVAIVTIASIFLTRYINFFYTLNQTDQDFFRPVLTTLLIVYSIYILYFVLVTISAVMLVVGAIRRDHNQMLLFLIMMGVGALTSFIQIFQLGLLFLIPSILAAVCSVYFFIGVYSLYKKIKLEKTRQPPSIYYENVSL